MRPDRYTVHPAAQGTPEWLQARVGYVTGSRASDITATRKDGKPSAAREDYLTQVVVERLTGQSADDGVVTPWMVRGSELEGAARSALETRLDTLIFESGFLQSTQLPWVGCSIDGYTSKGDIVELKVPKPKTHWRYLNAPTAMVRDYLDQCTHNLLVTGADACWLASYCPAMPPHMQLVVEVVLRFRVESYRMDYLEPFLAEVNSAVQTWRQPEGVTA